jgi:hypothetical protein
LSASEIHTAQADILEYDLPGLTGYYEYDTSNSSRTITLIYQGATARLERFQIYRSGQGDGCIVECEDGSGFEGYEWVNLAIRKSEEAYFFSKMFCFFLYGGPYDFASDFGWYRWEYAGSSYPGYPGWPQEIILNPGDTLEIRINIYCECDIGCSYFVPGYMILDDVVLSIDMNLSIVPVEETTWGRIKAFYENSP